MLSTENVVDTLIDSQHLPFLRLFLSSNGSLTDYMEKMGANPSPDSL